MAPLEEAFGVTLGASGRERLTANAMASPLSVLEEILARALSSPPCLVAFSGGRDSSAVLAVASQVARREGLALPVPVTARFGTAPSTDETGWQERMVRHAGCADWARLELSDELDLLGPYAQRLLLSCGNLFAFNVHFIAPLVERAGGGTLLTGVGGDEVFGMSQWRRAAGHLDPDGPWADRLAWGALGAVPIRVRRWALGADRHPVRQWMTEGAARQATSRWVHWLASHPLRRDRALCNWLWPSRYWQLARDALGLVGRLWGATVISPFMEPAFVEAAAAALGPAGFSSRAAAIEGLLGPAVLPDDLRQRRTKAVFDSVFFHHYSRAFIDQWTGNGVDTDLVDPERLAQEWRRLPRPDARSYSMLKAAWLAGQTALTAAPS